MRKSDIRRWDAETGWIAALAALASICSFLYYLRRGDLLLYGDAVAHINIARRVFDSRTPGPLQLGTVWLPLPHLLILPFVISDWLWQTGAGGSPPSMIAFVLGAVGIFRLVRGSLSGPSIPDGAARAAAWLAALIFIANPNLMYLQATAMTEPLSIALFIWAVVYLNGFSQAARRRDEDDDARARSSLVKCGWCLLGACLTRYDGWFLAVAISGLALIILLRRTSSGRIRTALKRLILMAAAGPALWLLYNGVVYRNPLEFANGPYSAHAIEQKSTSVSHPGDQNLWMAATFFLKSAELNVAANQVHRVWLLLALAGAMLLLALDSRLWPVLLLWVPLPFYTLSVAYSHVPIFLPVWWPHSYYNVRYGLELLPALAVFLALGAYYIAVFLRDSVKQAAVFAGFALLVVGSYWTVWREQPIGYHEAWMNSRTRLALERELGSTLKKLPVDSTVLMYLGDHVGALEREGIPLRRTINEGNHRTWKLPNDPDGLWEKSLASPAEYADYVVAFDGDAVDTAVHKATLFPIAEIHAAGHPSVIVYSTRR
jgi:hypothetical protein